MGEKIDSMLETYYEDSLEILEEMEKLILRIDKYAGDRKSLDSLFRSVHTLKGSSRFMELNGIADLAHDLENLLHGARNGDFEFKDQAVDLFFRGMKILKIFVDDIGKYGKEKKRDITDIQKDLADFLNAGQGNGEKLDDSVKGDYRQTEKKIGENPVIEVKDLDVSPVIWSEVLSDSEKEILFNVDENEKIYVIRIKLISTDSMDVARAFLYVRSVEEHSTFVKTFPSIEHMEEEFEGRVDLLLISDLNEKSVRELFDENADVEFFKVFGADSITNGEKVIDELVIPGILSKSDAVLEQNEEDNVLYEDFQEDEEIENSENTDKLCSKQETIRVSIDKLDILMNLLGELVINRTKSFGLANKLKRRSFYDVMVNNLLESLQEQSIVIHEMRERLMDSRLVPVNSIFQEVSLVVRDIAKRTGKEVECLISGENTEIDKRLVDSIKAPIMHAVKNAVDHGLEKPDIREVEKKSRTGHLWVKASREHNQILISITDDGKGIDREAVLRKAIEKNLVDPEHRDSLSGDKVLELICLPGFSTKDSVTGDSGRGVGMDVIKSMMEELNGEMQLHSDKGQGTTVSLRLPITLAVFQGLVVEDNNKQYVIPIDVVSEIVKLNYREIHMGESGEMMKKHRGKVLIIYELNKLLFGTEKKRQTDEHFITIVVRSGGKKTGIIVDRLIGEREIVIKKTNSLFIDIEGIAGTSIMGDGKVVPIVDIPNLLKLGNIKKQNIELATGSLM
ncbi:chemotaxis protein CheA [bacterium]|nr:chemotaxis protein CheA [bacterium]